MLSLFTTALFAVGAVAQDDPTPYCSAGPTSVQDSNLGQVTLEGIDDTHNCPGSTGVQVHLEEKASLVIGKSYTLKYHVTTCGGPYNRISGAWIDFNHNLVFDEDELLGFHKTTTQADDPKNISFTVPSTAALAVGTRLRVMVMESSADSIDPCAIFAYGGAKDFAIDIMKPKPPVPVNPHMLVLYTDDNCQANPSQVVGSNVTFGEDFQPWAGDPLTFHAPFMTATVTPQDMYTSVFISDDMQVLKIGAARPTPSKEYPRYFWELTATNLTSLVCAQWQAGFTISTPDSTQYQSYIVLRV